VTQRCSSLRVDVISRFAQDRVNIQTLPLFSCQIAVIGPIGLDVEKPRRMVAARRRPRAPVETAIGTGDVLKVELHAL
jgi:hypothetical protein